MAYLKIYCDYCGQTWEVYRRSMNDEHSRECPHCGSRIDDQTWRNQVVPALCMVSDANGALYGLRRKWRAHEGSSGLSCASVHF